MAYLKRKRIFPPALLLVFSTFSLLGAYISEYWFGMLPCHLCLYQRIPHFIVILLALLALWFYSKNKPYNWVSLLGGVFILIGALIAAYHTGVEQGIIIMDTSCADTLAPASNTLEEMRRQLLATPGVPCDKPQFVFLGLSMASWNMLLSLAVGIIVLVTSWKYRKHTKVRLDGKIL
jgi:disulfide bond formation protein DsbB